MPASTGRKKKTIGAEQLRKLLKDEVRKESQTAWAMKHGVSVAYVNDVLHQRKQDAVPEMIALALGYQRKILYERRK